MIRVTCDRCGEVKLPEQSITLRMHRQQIRNTYGFTCPACGLSHVRTAPAAIINYLSSARVKRVSVTIPDELLEKHTGPPLTADYVLDLSIQLGEDGVDVTECEPVTVTLPAPTGAPQP